MPWGRRAGTSWSVSAPTGPYGPEAHRPAGPVAEKPRNGFRVRRAIAALLALVSVFVAGTWTGWLLAADRDATVAGPEIITVARAPGTGQTVVADVRGLPVADATQALVDGGADPGAIVVTEQPSALAAGTVVAQDPVGGSPVVADGVALVVAAPATVPDLVGQQAAQAVPDLEATGARVVVEERYDPAAEVGTVLGIVPEPGEPLIEEVRLAVAGPAASVFLDQLRAVSGSCSAGDLQIDGTDHAHGLRCSSRTDEPSAEFLLDRGIARMAGIVGIPDDEEPGPAAQLVLLGDGRELVTVELVYGRAVPVDVSTTGVLRLGVRVQAAEDERVTAALGDVILYGARDAVDGLTDG